MSELRKAVFVSRIISVFQESVDDNGEICEDILIEGLNHFYLRTVEPELEKSPWIHVDDELPKTPWDVLFLSVVGSTSKIGLGYYGNDSWVLYGCSQHWKPTYWQRIQAPPEETE